MKTDYTMEPSTLLGVLFYMLSCNTFQLPEHRNKESALFGKVVLNMQRLLAKSSFLKKALFFQFAKCNRERLFIGALNAAKEYTKPQRPFRSQSEDLCLPLARKYFQESLRGALRFFLYLFFDSHKFLTYWKRG